MNYGLVPPDVLPGPNKSASLSSQELPMEGAIIPLGGREAMAGEPKGHAGTMVKVLIHSTHAMIRGIHSQCHDSISLRDEHQG